MKGSLLSLRVTEHLLSGFHTGKPQYNSRHTASALSETQNAWAKQQEEAVSLAGVVLWAENEGLGGGFVLSNVRLCSKGPHFRAYDRWVRGWGGPGVKSVSILGLWFVGDCLVSFEYLPKAAYLHPYVSQALGTGRLLRGPRDKPISPSQHLPYPGRVCRSTFSLHCPEELGPSPLHGSPLLLPHPLSGGSIHPKTWHPELSVPEVV